MIHLACELEIRLFRLPKKEKHFSNFTDQKKGRKSMTTYFYKLSLKAKKEQIEHQKKKNNFPTHKKWKEAQN